MISHDHYTEARAPLVGASDRRLQLSPTMASRAATSRRPDAIRQHHPHRHRRRLRRPGRRAASSDAKAYYEDGARTLQPAQWELCTIVQQCPVPKYGLALGSFAPVMRTHFFGALALALSDESYKRILVQELSNLLLGEMQTWAVSCAGGCAELKDADGLLPSHLLQGEELPVTTLDVSKAECSKMA